MTPMEEQISFPEKNPQKKSSDSDRSVADNIIYVDWDGPNDPENPYNWSKTRKWVINAIGGAFLTLVGMANAGYAISQPSLERALNVSDATASLGVVMFTISFGMAPLVLAPFSETYGRRPIYIASALLFWITFLPVPLAKNIGTVLVARFFCGVGASTSVSIVGGMLADIWQTHERGLPMAIFSYVAFAGTGLGPVVFGYIELTLGYKFVNWILFAFSGLVTIILTLYSKETRSSVLLVRKAERLRRETGNQNYRAKAEEERSSLHKLVATSLTRPVRLLCREPVLLSFTLWMTYAWGILYLMLQAIPIVFTELYNFNSGENGLMFSGQIIGPTVGMVMNHWCDKLYVKNVGRKGPEARLYIAMISGVLLPVGCWMYGMCYVPFLWDLWIDRLKAWTGTKSISWVVPAIAINIIYAAMFGIYTACFNYITDSYVMYASSALGGQSAVRLTSGAIFTVLAEPLYNRLGIHLAGTLLAALSTAFAITPFILYHYGAIIRAKSPFAKKLAGLERLKEPRSDPSFSLESTTKTEV